MPSGRQADVKRERPAGARTPALDACLTLWTNDPLGFDRETAVKLVLGLGLLALGALAGSACFSYRAVSEPLPVVLARPQTVRVHGAMGARVEIGTARITGDSLVGRDPWGPTPGELGVTSVRLLAVRLSDVRKVEVRKFDRGKTVTRVVVSVGALVGFTAWHVATYGF